MEDFRSKSCGDGRMQIGNYYGPTTTTAGPNLNGNGMQDLQFRHLHILMIQSCKGRSGLLAIRFTLLKAKLQLKGLSRRVLGGLRIGIQCFRVLF
ncbi:hypothetical protein Patl1_36960 [Pistacia atlantica]|nr:hypothetical protein Patl1_36960 [Pistacia atlantica]